MNRAEFMKRLEELLADIPEEERVEALEYYEGYFEDGGPEREEEIIRELESPEVTAAMIKEDIEEIPRDGVQNAPVLREQTAEEKETPPARKGYRYQRTMNSKKKENGPKYRNGRGSESRWGKKAMDQQDIESDSDPRNYSGWSSDCLTTGAGRSWNDPCTDRSADLCVRCALGDSRCVFDFGSGRSNLGIDSNLYDSVSGDFPIGSRPDYDSFKSDCSCGIHETVSDCVSGHVPLGR